jgi:hypothetical protein
MAVVAVTSKNAVGAVNPAAITIGTSGDTLVYTPDQNQELWLYNTTASGVVVTIDGSSGTTVTVPGTAGTTISVASGLAITVPANGFTTLALDKATAFLQGTVAITAATGAAVKAAIVTPY